MTIRKMLPFLLISLLYITQATAQPRNAWQGKECAVVLTYDDGLDVHLTNVIPALDSLGLHATFYIADYSGKLKSRVPEWRMAAAAGHELGNHTVSHPCEGGRPGREFVVPHDDLNNYTVARVVSEIKKMDSLLQDIDGKTKRTFAYPCGDTKIHDTAYIDGLKSDFAGARGVQPVMQPAGKIDLYNIGCYAINGQTGDQMIGLVKKAMKNRALLVFLFHGVGGGHDLNVSLAAHSQLLHFLKQQEKNIWVAPMADVAMYIRQYQQQK
jgi:peptidoglycan-N-acetylglucosamine deacetylase